MLKNKDSYIELLETVILSLLEERNSDSDIKCIETDSPYFKDCTFSTYNIKQEIESHQNLKSIFSKMFDNESELVDAIKIYLLTEEQRLFLFNSKLSIEDCLNGRFSGKLNSEIGTMFRDWNNKIGADYFLDSLFI